MEHQHKIRYCSRPTIKVVKEYVWGTHLSLKLRLSNTSQYTVKIIIIIITYLILYALLYISCICKKYEFSAEHWQVYVFFFDLHIKIIELRCPS